MPVHTEREPRVHMSIRIDRHARITTHARTFADSRTEQKKIACLVEYTSQAEAEQLNK